MATLPSSQRCSQCSLLWTDQTTPDGKHCSCISWKVQDRSCMIYWRTVHFRLGERRRITTDLLLTSPWSRQSTVMLPHEWRDRILSKFWEHDTPLVTEHEPACCGSHRATNIGGLEVGENVTTQCSPSRIKRDNRQMAELSARLDEYCNPFSCSNFLGERCNRSSSIETYWNIPTKTRWKEVKTKETNFKTNGRPTTPGFYNQWNARGCRTSLLKTRRRNPGCPL